MQRTADKALVDKLIRLGREYRKTGDKDLLKKKFSIADRLSENVFGFDDAWISFCDLIDSVIGRSNPLLPDATNQQIYDILKICGITVSGTETLDRTTDPNAGYTGGDGGKGIDDEYYDVLSPEEKAKIHEAYAQ